MKSFEVIDHAGIRYMCCRDTGVVQGHILIEQPDLPIVPYLRAALSTLLLNPLSTRKSRALVIGLGAGVVPGFLLRNFSHCRVTVVEIDADVIETARSQFYFPGDHPRLEVITGCGFEYVKNCNICFDWIFVDGFNERAEVGPLLDMTFFHFLRKLLKPSSTLVINSVAQYQQPEIIAARLRRAIPHLVFSIDVEESLNFLTLGLPSDFTLPSCDFLQRRAHDFKSQTTLDLIPDLHRLHKSLP